MLLSRQAFPTPVLGATDISPTYAAVATMTVKPFTGERPIGEMGPRVPSDPGVEVSPRLGRGRVEPLIVGRDAEPTETQLFLDAESDPSRSSPDDAWADDFVGAEDEAPPEILPTLPPTPEWALPPQIVADPLPEWTDDGFYNDFGGLNEGLDDIPWDALDDIPWQGDYTVTGWMDASRAQIAYRIPVGPGTSSVWLAIHPGRDESGPPPLIDRLYLVDSTGAIVEKITSASIGDEDGGRQLVVALQGAPEGSKLLVCLTMRCETFPASPGDGADPGAGPEGDPSSPLARTFFELNIQRNDPDPSGTYGGGGGIESPQDTSPAPSPPPPIVPPRASAGYGSIAWNYAQTSRLIVIGVGRGLSVDGGSSTSAFSWAEAGRTVGGRGPSVYLGPLVSRGAAPLGPTLATSVDEPTELIDRANHAVDEALDQIGADLDARLLAGMRGLDGPAPDDAAVTRAIPGAGGLPVLVSATTRVRKQAEADELAANLHSRSVEEALTAEAPESPSTTDPGADDVKLANAGMITRAAGLVVGLGLATGPLYPDLVALARRKLARGKGSSIKRRWRFFRRGRASRPVF